MSLKKKRKWNYEIEPDEIFLDSHNSPQFDVQQLEGKIEKPISKRTIVFLGLSFIMIGLIFIARVWNFQIKKGEAYFEKSENISLEHKMIFSERGLIYDRNNIPLVWNVINTENEPFSKRIYIRKNGFGHLLGYISYPLKDKDGFYWQNEFVGKDGLEKQYNSFLNGKNGLKLIEVNVKGEIQSENVVEPAESGQNAIISIDSRIQNEMYELIRKWTDLASFEGGTGIILDVENGEVLAMANFPEYDPQVLTEANEREIIASYVSDKRKPFLNRSLSGLYTPGSVVKPFIAIGALNEGIVDPLKKILSTGSLTVPNPYFPDKPQVFHDNKAHGWVDMRRALAVSSNVYFYEIGGGFEEQSGLGILNIEKYVKLFGLGEKSGIDLPGEIAGIIPSPEWKLKAFNGDSWRVGDTYNTSIGQYGFQVTPLEIVRGISQIANNGKIIKPKILLDQNIIDTNSNEEYIDLNQYFFQIVKEGMRQAVTDGTATRLNLPFIKVAAKTGTAQVGAKRKFMNSWVSGFFPLDSPKYAFVVMLESAPSTNTIGATNVMADLLEWMNLNTPEYLVSSI